MAAAGGTASSTSDTGCRTLVGIVQIRVCQKKSEDRLRDTAFIVSYNAGSRNLSFDSFDISVYIVQRRDTNFRTNLAALYVGYQDFSYSMTFCEILITKFLLQENATTFPPPCHFTSYLPCVYEDNYNYCTFFQAVLRIILRQKNSMQ